MSADSNKSVLSNILAIAGFIILIIIVIWGLVHLARLSAPWFSSLFDSKTEEKPALVISAPSEVESGQSVKISWTHTSTDAGMYAFVYKCEEGLSFKVTAPDNTKLPVPCGAAFNAGPSKSITVTPTITGTATLKAPYSIIFMPSATGTQAVANAVFTITSGTKEEPTPEPTPKPAPRPTPNPSQGVPDLSVSIQSVYSEGYGSAVVVFDIANQGRASTGTWYFEAQLPTSQPYTYFSPPQASLAPGSHIVNTLRFTQSAGGNVFISVDPSNAVRESNEGNNTAIRPVIGTVPAPYPIY